MYRALASAGLLSAPVADAVRLTVIKHSNRNHSIECCNCSESVERPRELRRSADHDDRYDKRSCRCAMCSSGRGSISSPASSPAKPSGNKTRGGLSRVQRAGAKWTLARWQGRQRAHHQRPPPPPPPPSSPLLGPHHAQAAAPERTPPSAGWGGAMVGGAGV